MALKLITPPQDFVTLEELKLHMGVDSDETDELIDSLGRAVTKYIEVTLTIALMPQVWDLYLDKFPGCGSWHQRYSNGAIKIPLVPLLSVDSVNYIDANGDEIVVSPTDYEVDTVSFDGWVVPGSSFSWPAPMETINAVRVRFTAGYVNAQSVLKPIKLAICMMVKNIFLTTLASSITMRDLALTSETVDGVGSLTWRNGISGFSNSAELIKATDYTVEALLAPYRRIYL